MFGTIRGLSEEVNEFREYDFDNEIVQSGNFYGQKCNPLMLTNTTKKAYSPVCIRLEPLRDYERVNIYEKVA